jgi:hypothetical protein
LTKILYTLSSDVIDAIQTNDTVLLPDTQLKQTQVTTLTLQNKGLVPIQYIAATSDFQISPGTGAVEIGGSVPLTISFFGQSVGPISRQCTLAVIGAKKLVFTVKVVVGEPCAQLGSLIFRLDLSTESALERACDPTTSKPHPVSSTLTIKNTGNLPLTLGLAPESELSFSLDPATVAVPQNQSATLQVTHQVRSFSKLNGNIAFASNSLTQPIIQCSYKYLLLMPILELNPRSALNLGCLAPNTEHKSTITISNRSDTYPATFFLRIPTPPSNLFSQCTIFQTDKDSTHEQNSDGAYQLGPKKHLEFILQVRTLSECESFTMRILGTKMQR